MPTIHTYEILAEGFTAHLVHLLAKAFGVNESTVRAWRQPKESDANPTGTGKRNPLDQAARLIRIVHKYNPGNARQAVQYFIDLIDELDRASGVDCEADGEVDEIVEKLCDTIREGADVQIVLARAHLDKDTLRSARKEIAEGISALHRLDSAVSAQLEREMTDAGTAVN